MANKPLYAVDGAYFCPYCDYEVPHFPAKRMIEDGGICHGCKKIINEGISLKWINARAEEILSCDMTDQYLCNCIHIVNKRLVHKETEQSNEFFRNMDEIDRQILSVFVQEQHARNLYLMSFKKDVYK